MGQQPPDSPASGWGQFPDTVLRFRSRPSSSSSSSLVIDLRNRVDIDTRIALRGIGIEQSFGILSAQEPMGLPQSKDVDARLAASLKTEVAALGARHVHLDACSPDGSHCERSIAIVLDLESLIALAYRYNQLAIFWFDGEEFWIVPVRSSNARLRLPVSA